MTSDRDTGTTPHHLLERFSCVSSTDLQEVRTQIGQVFCEHDLRVVGTGQRLDTRLYFRRLGDIGVGRLCYGAGVDIDPGTLQDFFLLQLPLNGSETIVAGGHTVHSTPDMASIISPSLSFHMRHGAGTEKLFIRIDRSALERQFGQNHARPPGGAIEFAPGIDLGSSAGLALRRMAAWMFTEASDGSLLDQPLIAARVEEALMTTLLESLPHNQQELTLLAASEPTISPRFMRRAREYIEAHCDQPLTAGRIASSAGVSTRSLFAGFRKYRATTPMAYLRDLRLDRVRAELQAEDGCSVTATALRWGFSHLGQFSAAYRRRFGDLPSHTRALAQGNTLGQAQFPARSRVSKPD